MEDCTSGMKSWSIEWKCTYIYIGLWTLEMKCTRYGFWTSGFQEQWSLSAGRDRAGRATIFNWDHKIQNPYHM